MQLRKVAKIPSYLFRLPFFLFFAGYLYIKKLRIYEVYANRIGHFIDDMQIVYASGMYKNLVFYFDEKCCNKFLGNKIYENFRSIKYNKKFFGKRFVEKFKKLFIFLNLYKHFFYQISPEIRKLYQFKKAKPWFSLTKKDILKGDEILKQIGIFPNNKFVAMLSRNNYYLKSQGEKSQQLYENQYRNWSCADLIPSIKFLARKKIFSVLINNSSNEIPNFKSPFFFKYGDSKYKSDFLDVYLAYKCKFAVCASSGWYSLPFLFRKKIILVNHLPLNEIPFWHNNVFILLKTLFCLKTRKPLKVEDILKSEISSFLKTSDYTKNKILPKNVPKKEILQVCRFITRDLKRISLCSKKIKDQILSKISGKVKNKKNKLSFFKSKIVVYK